MIELSCPTSSPSGDNLRNDPGHRDHTPQDVVLRTDKPAEDGVAGQPHIWAVKGCAVNSTLQDVKLVPQKQLGNLEQFGIRPEGGCGPGEPVKGNLERGCREQSYQHNQTLSVRRLYS
jgi:hypothetical protein